MRSSLQGGGFFVVGFVCACCYLGADCLCGLPFSCDVFDVKMKVASHNSKGLVHKAMMFV